MVRMGMRIECMKGEEKRGDTNYRDSLLPFASHCRRGIYTIDPDM